MSKPVDIHELERMRRFAAFLILEFGPEYGFVLARVETMLEAAQKDDPTAKALKVLQELKSASPKPGPLTSIPNNTRV